MDKKTQFKLYIFFISLMSILTANYTSIISPNEGRVFVIFVLSSITLVLIHMKYFKFFKSVAVDENKYIAKGLLYSSIVGFVLILIVSIYNFAYTIGPKYDPDKSEAVITQTLIILILIYLISAIIFSIYSMNLRKKISNVNKIFASFGFYALIFVVNYIIFIFLLGLTGGFG